jgi:hypothetical protein
LIFQQKGIEQARVAGPEAGNQAVLVFGWSGTPACFSGFFRQDHCDKLVHRRDILLGGFPQHFVIYPEGFMNEFISHSRHLFPGNLWMSLPHGERDFLGSFADNLKGSNHCIDRFLVLSELVPGYS